jgi:hypothetical protein
MATEGTEPGAATEGIEGLYVETHNWGKTVAFWRELGFVLEFETDHHSGQLRHPSGGPYLFVAERPAGESLDLSPIVRSPDSTAFEAPSAGTVEEPFTPKHWGVVEMSLRDADGRRVSIQAPLPEGVEAPAGHG